MENVRIKYNTPQKDDKGKMAVVYARYSSHSQGEQSIEGQLAAAQAYARAKGYTIIHEYVDRAMTGRNDNRDEFQKMLSDCAKKQFQVIIVWKVDRFGRNREEITFNKYRAKKHGVRVEYVAENLPDSPEGVILESVLEGMAEYYSLQLSQNIRRGYMENAKKGKYSGGHIPLGYKLDAEKRFIIDPDTAPVVKMIFSQYAAGKTTTEIITQLNEQGYKTALGKPFNKNSLRTILKNKKYIGVFTFKGGEIVIENGLPAIIDRETFDRVQDLLKYNQKAAAHHGDVADYILSGKLFCGRCGAMMTGESGTSKNGRMYYYYLCATKKHRKACDKKAVRRDWIEDFVLQRVQGIVRDEKLLHYIADCVWDYYLQQDAEQEELRRLQRQLADVDQAITNLLQAVEAGMFNDAVKNRMDNLNQQRENLAATIAGLELQKGFKLSKDHILFFLEQFRDMDFTDRECQRRLIEVFVNSIFAYDDHLTISFNYGGETTTLTLQDMEKAEGECSTTAHSAPPCSGKLSKGQFPGTFYCHNSSSKEILKSISTS